MKLKPDDLVMVRVKAFTGDHKIADQWEDTPHQVIGQLGDQLFLKYNLLMLHLIIILGFLPQKYVISSQNK